MRLQHSLRGALAGAVAALVWAAQQPLDKRVFQSPYDDVELLGKLLTRGRAWPILGLCWHLQNGAAFGAAYAMAKPVLVGPPLARGLTASMVEHFALWPLGRLSDRHHPARRQLEPFGGNVRALAQGSWRHALFGVVLGVLEHRWNAGSPGEPTRGGA